MAVVDRSWTPESTLKASGVSYIRSISPISGVAVPPSVSATPRGPRSGGGSSCGRTAGPQNCRRATRPLRPPDAPDVCVATPRVLASPGGEFASVTWSVIVLCPLVGHSWRIDHMWPAGGSGSARKKNITFCYWLIIGELTAILRGYWYRMKYPSHIVISIMTYISSSTWTLLHHSSTGKSIVSSKSSAFFISYTKLFRLIGTVQVNLTLVKFSDKVSCNFWMITVFSSIRLALKPH